MFTMPNPIWNPMSSPAIWTPAKMTLTARPRHRPMRSSWTSSTVSVMTSSPSAAMPGAGTTGMITRLRKNAMMAAIRLGTISALKKGTSAKMIPTRAKTKIKERMSCHARLSSSFIGSSAGCC